MPSRWYGSLAAPGLYAARAARRAVPVEVTFTGQIFGWECDRRGVDVLARRRRDRRRHRRGRRVGGKGPVVGRRAAVQARAVIYGGLVDGRSLVGRVRVVRCRPVLHRGVIQAVVDVLGLPRISVRGILPGRLRRLLARVIGRGWRRRYGR